MNFNVYLNSLRQKGNLAYEYNPLYNFQTDVDLYIIDNKYIIPSGKAVNLKNGEILTKKSDKWVDKNEVIVSSNDVKPAEEGDLWAKAGSLIDLDTEQLNFDLEHPVEIEVQPSYDGSVNLILNDDKNIPRLINSRFSVREKNTYEIVDRVGENDSNIYSSKSFDKDSSLYFQCESNPIINYLGFVQGTLPVGQYCFYITYCDADNNESDFIAETGVISVFLGKDNDPTSMDGGIKNQSSNKGIILKLSNIDKSYNYFKVYYVRYFADYNQNRVVECKKLEKRFRISFGQFVFHITGQEEVEDLDPNILNISRFNPKSILTQAQCKNMLFFGNIVKNSDNYTELRDLALRIVPELNVTKDFNSLKNDYTSDTLKNGYYDSLTIYNKTGYFNQEYYRFGVVFIYNNGSLSNVYNTLGGELSNLNQLNLSGELYDIKDKVLLTRNYIKIDDDGWVKSGNYDLSGKYINSRGVCLLNYSEIDSNGNEIGYDDKTIFSIKFIIPENVSQHLRNELGIRSLFFVRQKCMPNIIAQCYLLPMDEVLQAPAIPLSGEYYTECFVNTLPLKKDDNKVNQDRLIVTNDYESRLYEYSSLDKLNISSNAYAAICPDFSLNQPYYNQIFNSGKFKIQKVSNNSKLEQSKTYKRFYNENANSKNFTSNSYSDASICSVTEDVPTVAIKNKTYKLEIGKTEEVFRFGYAGYDYGTYNQGDDSKNDEVITKVNDDDTIEIENGTSQQKAMQAANIVRGKYSPYLAIYSESKLETECLYNIYSDNLLSTSQNFQDRMESSEPFYAISDRFNLINQEQSYVCYRGDCYINQYTHRLNRNFNDPSLPNNDEIIDKNTWRKNYPKGSEYWSKISRSDINAVKLGSWINIRVRSAMNYALRSVDHSYVSEEALMGAPRSFYPRSFLLEKGANKLPDSYLYNDAYRASLGFKQYYTVQDVNYIKDTFSNRIQYSAVAVQDSYKNNYRYSLSTYFRDYSMEYGSIQKLVELNGNLLVIFEHGIGLAVINERILVGSGESDPVYINTQNVLPEELAIISDSIGTQWGDSVIKTDSGAVYGVDTVAKKIWRLQNQQLEILSDFKVNKFLIDNISLGERELYPTIGLKNVKTHYNANKRDIMFTFYDDVYKDEEKAWNLCYNELLGQFITFYSWIPSYSANIDNRFFSFDRNIAKELALLQKSNYSIPENTGVLVECPVFNDETLKEGLQLYYVSKEKSCSATYTVLNADGTTSTKTIGVEGKDSSERNNYVVEDVSFKLEKDHWQNYKLFNIVDGKLVPNHIALVKNALEHQKVILLYITPYIETQEKFYLEVTQQLQFPTEMIALTLDSIVENPLLTSDEKSRAGLTTDFYLHGQAGIFDVVENLYPTYWYGQQHPFEFEFVINDKIGQQKIFENLVIIANKAEPESFHFEIEGDNYEFSSDKRNMYFRQEATKNLYQNLGSDILYNRQYTDVAATQYTQETYYRPKTKGEQITNDGIRLKPIYENYPIHYHDGLVQQAKSTIFPLYYERIDTYNDIYHKYHMMKSADGMYDFQNLSGSEISWDRGLNQFNIVTHIKNNQIDVVGRLRGNSRYKEGKWNIQIPSITFMQKNEKEWPTKDSIYPDLIKEGPLSQTGSDYQIPPVVINSQYVPRDLDSENLEILKNIYSGRMNNLDDTLGWEANENKQELSKYIDTSSWSYRKEARIRDKWMKVRIRYSGKNLAVIHSVVTLYNLSYS